MRSRTRQSPSRLEALRKEVEVEARELARIQSEHSRLVSDNDVQRRDAIRLSDEKQVLSSDIAKLEEQIKNLTSTYEDVAAQIDKGHQAVRDAEGAVVVLEDRAEVVRGEIRDLGHSCETKTFEAGGVSAELSRKKGELDALLSEKVSVEQAITHGRAELVEIEAKKERVQGMIEEAMANFRIYEMRIAQFSEDTGYLVGYTRPDLLTH